MNLKTRTKYRIVQHLEQYYVVADAELFLTIFGREYILCLSYVPGQAKQDAVMTMAKVEATHLLYRALYLDPNRTPHFDA